MGELNLHNLQSYIDDYDIKVFVETGTGKAFGLQYALRFPFKKLYSIEIKEELYKENEKRINDVRCKLLLNNSLDGLIEIFKETPIDCPVLFWLDAHFPGADYRLGNYDDILPKNLKLPLEDEINLICASRVGNKDVFIIDDLNLYEEGDYQLGNVLDRHKRFGLDGIEFIEKSFTKTHNLKKDYRHQGFVILEPKVRKEKS